MSNQKKLYSKRMNILLIMIGVVIGAIFLSSRFSVEANAASSKTSQAMKAYYNYLNKGCISWNDHYFQAEDLEFACVDINKDSYPELIVYNNGGYKYDYPLAVYTYYNGKMKQIMQDLYANKVTVYQTSKIFTYSYTMKNCTFSYYYGISKGKVVSKAKRVVYADNSVKYYIGSKKVAKTKYNSYIKTLQKGKKSYSRVTNTAANRKSVFGKYFTIYKSPSNLTLESVPAEYYEGMEGDGQWAVANWNKVSNMKGYRVKVYYKSEDDIYWRKCTDEYTTDNKYYVGLGSGFLENDLFRVSVQAYKVINGSKVYGLAKTVTKSGQNFESEFNKDINMTVSSTQVGIFENDYSIVTVSMPANNAYVTYQVDDSDIVGCSWANSWNGSNIDLYLYGRSPGSTYVTISNSLNNQTIRIAVSVY